MKATKTLCQCRACGALNHYKGRVHDGSGETLSDGWSVGFTLIHPELNCFIWSKCCGSLLDIVALKPAPIDNGFGPYQDAPFSHDPFAGVPGALECIGGPNDGDWWQNTHHSVSGAYFEQEGLRHSPIYIRSTTAKGRLAYIFSEVWNTTPTPPTK